MKGSLTQHPVNLYGAADVGEGHQWRLLWFNVTSSFQKHMPCSETRQPVRAAPLPLPLNRPLLLQVHPDAHLPIACPPLSSLRPWPHFAGDAIWSAFGLFSFICLIPAEDVTMVTAQQQSLALSALRVSTSTLQLNVPIFAPIGGIPGHSLSGFSRVIGRDGVEALVSMEMDNVDDEEEAGIDCMSPLTYVTRFPRCCVVTFRAVTSASARAPRCSRICAQISPTIAWSHSHLSTSLQVSMRRNKFGKKLAVTRAAASSLFPLDLQ